MPLELAVIVLYGAHRLEMIRFATWPKIDNGILSFLNENTMIQFVLLSWMIVWPQSAFRIEKCVQNNPFSIDDSDTYIEWLLFNFATTLKFKNQ